MNHLTANLALIRTRFPVLAHNILETGPSDEITTQTARDGSPVAHERFGERSYPLHSMVAPTRESRRMLESIGDAGFVIVWGLGSGWHLTGLVEENRRELLLIIDGTDRLRSLLSSRDYTQLLAYQRLQILVSPSSCELANALIHWYLPGLHGAIAFYSLTALRSRVAERYNELKDGIEAGLATVRADFSVQTHFGLRWTSNILRNLKYLPHSDNMMETFIGQVRDCSGRIMVIGAGPSLIRSLPEISEARSKTFIIATDTALPVLLGGGITPDTVVSIDTQFYTLLHCEQPGSLNIPWWVSLSAPSPLTRNLQNPCFFCGGNPLEKQIAAQTGLPVLDTDGGNVLQTALSLACSLEGTRVVLFGSDYRNPAGIPYPPGSYVERWFTSRSDRTRPSESCLVTFSFKSREERTLTEFEPDYPNARLEQYQRVMQDYLDGYPLHVENRGLGRLRSTGSAPRRIRKSQQNDSNPPAVPLEELRSNLHQVISQGSHNALPLLYPLIAYLRNRPGNESVESEGLIRNARELFLKLLDLS